MDQKKVLEKLLKIAENQQKIIVKLAQQALPPDSLPTSGANVSGGNAAPVSQQPPPTALKPDHKKPFGGEGQAVMDLLAPAVAALINSIQVGPGVVNVSFKQGGATQDNYNAVLAAVQQAQTSGKLTGSNYKVHVA